MELPPACLDLSDYKLKIDHFDQMHVLNDESKVEGAENFRQVAGFPVFGTAQPSEEGFLKVLDKLPKVRNRIIFFCHFFLIKLFFFNSVKGFFLISFAIYRFVILFRGPFLYFFSIEK